MRSSTLFAVFLAAICPGLVIAGEVTLIDPNFDDVPYATAFGAYATVNPSSVGLGWFTDGALSQCRRQQLIAGKHWGTIVGQSGTQAALASQFNVEPVPNRGASIFQTVYLEAGKTYTLTAGVGTGKGNTGDGIGSVSKNDAQFDIGFTTAPVAPPSNPYTGDLRPMDVTLLAGTAGISTNMNGVFTDYACDFTPAVSGNYNIALRNRGWVPGTGAMGITSTVWFDNVRLTYVPEPSAALLLICGGAGLLVRRRQA